jgi:hypothetical protein
LGGRFSLVDFLAGKISFEILSSMLALEVFWREKLFLNFVENLLPRKSFNAGIGGFLAGKISFEILSSMLALGVLGGGFSLAGFGFGGKFEILNLSEIFS